jgi:hypothetical protein
MDLRTATSLLSNAENIKYFKDQLRHFQVEQSNSLKEYLDTIKTDGTAWLNSLPKGIKSKSTFHKYKAPIYSLLEHTDVVSVYGENYCSAVLKSMKQAFKESIDDIINHRKGNNTSTLDDNATVSTDANECDDEDSSLDLNALEVAEPSNTTTSDVVVEDYKKLYDLLNRKHNDLLNEHIRLKTMLERADSELSRVWGLLNRMVSK